ncbi:MAG: hypothetical protein WC091_24840, partial [Sulfuricellaceae bacterium]
FGQQESSVMRAKTDVPPIHVRPNIPTFVGAILEKPCAFKPLWQIKNNINFDSLHEILVMK